MDLNEFAMRCTVDIGAGECLPKMYCIVSAKGLQCTGMNLKSIRISSKLNTNTRHYNILTLAIPSAAVDVCGLRLNDPSAEHPVRATAVLDQ